MVPSARLFRPGLWMSKSCAFRSSSASDEYAKHRPRHQHDHHSDTCQSVLPEDLGERRFIAIFGAKVDHDVDGPDETSQYADQSPSQQIHDPILGRGGYYYNQRWGFGSVKRPTAQRRPSTPNSD